MRAFVVGNVTIDEVIGIAAMPAKGASILGVQQARDLGGKGANQAIVMARCGVPTTLVAAIGEDYRADSIKRRLSHEPVDASLIVIAGGSSDCSVIFNTPDGENAIVTTTDSAAALNFEAVAAALAAAEPGDLMILQGNLSRDTTKGALDFARARSMRTAFNPSPIRPFFSQLWRQLDFVFLNEGEARALTGSSSAEALHSLMQMGVSQAVLTLGGDGAILADGDAIVTVPATPCAVVDTTGAGDTFMAVALASALLHGGGLDARAIGHAAAAAAITVSSAGTLSAFPDEAEAQRILTT